MKRINSIILGLSFFALAACQGEMQDAQMGHDHAAMQAGQSKTSQVQSPEQVAQTYTCPMHPHYISTDPDGTCPICGMDLVPVTSGTAQDNAVSVSPDMIQTMGIRTSPVTAYNFNNSLRAYGTVEPNTRLESMAASRLEGWISGLTVRAEGDVVRRGQRLYFIYAPDLIAAQKDYLASLRIGNTRRIEAVTQRLKSVGLQDSLIERLTETQELIDRVPVYSEGYGVVTELMVRDGDYLKPGDPVVRLQRYDKVWVIASIPESDLSNMSEGLTATLDFETLPNDPIQGRVDYIYPTINAETRTARVRIGLDNDDGKLKPGAYADIRFERDNDEKTTSALAVPSQAILRDSRGSHVILALGDGRFEPKAVRTGRNANGRVEILSGLSAGDVIVSSGQFMLDSEASLRSGFSAREDALPAFDENTPLSDLPINAAKLSEIDHLIDTALYFHEALVDGYQIDPYFLDPTLALITKLETEFDGSKLAPILTEAKSTILSAKDNRSGDDLAASLARLMTALDPWLVLGAPSHYNQKGVLFFSDVQTGRLWLQMGGQAANPYSNGEARLIPWPDPMANMSDAP